MNTKYKAVFWDFGGVISTSPFDNFRCYEKQHQLPDNFLRTINSKNPNNNAWAQFERGNIDIEAFDQLFQQESELAGHSVSGKTVVKLLACDLRPEMIAALKIIKQHYLIACLTNNVQAGHGAQMSKNTTAEQAVTNVMSEFSTVIESSQVGYRKPEPLFYQSACERTGINARHVVYLDDLGINLKPAKAMGMTTIKVTSSSQALTELANTLDLPSLLELAQQ